MEKRLLFCDKHFAIVNKNPGEVCSLEDGKSSDSSYLPKIFEKSISYKLGKKPEIIECVNRIDKPVSGIVILALSKFANSELSIQLKNHYIEKKYYAIVEGCFKPFPKEKENCLLKNLISFNKENQKAYIYNEKQNKNLKSSYYPDIFKYKNAELLYRVIGSGNFYSFLEIQLLTGRTHQIRCQLANNKMPIKGDLKYGAKRSEKNGGIRLHAGKLSLLHPLTKEKMTFTADFPYEDALWNEVKKSIEKSEE